ncbi:hypothetical protein BpHYR1_049759 [Brachionus plicatilis]|uniref:Uncharacterized protein n=1 Tax=Brachionus plicatilis TaxID=10195 RepID=A0A3M7RLH7_BRAPC|nr:hypothetical protein BpHYR1_049759 [Brachionus plicatilis]
MNLNFSWQLLVQTFDLCVAFVVLKGSFGCLPIGENNVFTRKLVNKIIEESEISRKKLNKNSLIAEFNELLDDEPRKYPEETRRKILELLKQKKSLKFLLINNSFDSTTPTPDIWEMQKSNKKL